MINPAARLANRYGIKAVIKPSDIPPFLHDRATAARWELPDPGMYENQARLYLRLSWVYSAVNIVGETCALQALNVKRQVGTETEDIDNHPFELLLMKPNPLQSRFELLRDTISFLALNGGAYWWMNRGSEKEEPAEIWLLPSWRVQPIPDGKLFLSGYEYDPGAGFEKRLLPLHQIAHFKSFNPLSEFIGASSIEPIATSAQTDLSSQQWSAKFYGPNNGRLPGILAFRDQINNEIAWQKIKDDVTYAAETRNILMMRGVGDRIDWIQAAATQADMQQLEQRQMTKEEIYSVMAPGLASMLAINATEANSKAGKQTFLEMAIWPRLVMVAQKITLDVLPAYGTDLVAEFDDPRQVDRVLEMAEQDAYGKTHTVDEIRKEYYQDDPIGDERGDMLPAQIGPGTAMPGDEPEPAAVPAQLQPFAGQSNPAQPVEEQPEQQAEAQLPEPAEPDSPAIRSDLAAWRRKSLHALKAGRGAAVVFDASSIPAELHADIWAQLAECKTAGDVRDVFDAAMTGSVKAEAVGDDALAAALNRAVDLLEAVKGGPGSGNFGHEGRPGEAGGSGGGGGGGKVSVVTETDRATAEILLTQGLEPSFKPQVSEISEYAPGLGLERAGTYVAKEGAFSKGSFGPVRIHMDVSEDQLAVPQELAQLGETDVNRALGNENGAVTYGAIDPGRITSVEVNEGGKWKEYTRQEYLNKIGRSNTPKLPPVEKYRAELQKNAANFRLSPDQVDNLVFDYNRGTLDEKIALAEELGLSSGG